MLTRSAIAVLGSMVAALALSALAHVESDLPPAVRAPRRAPRTMASAPAVIALRDGATLDLNGAGAPDLELLPGIGPSLAQRIVEHRVRNGPFASVDDLLRVRGVGARTLMRLRAFLRVETPRGELPGVPAPAAATRSTSTPPKR